MAESPGGRWAVVVALPQVARDERMRLTARCWQVGGWGRGEGRSTGEGWVRRGSQAGEQRSRSLRGPTRP